MRSFSLSTDSASSNIGPGVYVHCGPPEVSLEQSESSIHPRMAGET